MKRGDLVYIKWEDSAGCPMGWQLLRTARGVRVSKVESVGWVLAKTKRAVQLAPHIVTVGGGCVQGHISIPRSAILAERVIEKA